MTAPSLARKTFSISRLAEFATVAELTKHTGHPVGKWPPVIVKELVDNALDAADDAGTAPSIEIVVTDNSITVADRGPGIAPSTVASLIDYSVRTSSRAANGCAIIWPRILERHGTTPSGPSSLRCLRTKRTREPRDGLDAKPGWRGLRMPARWLG